MMGKSRETGDNPVKKIIPMIAASVLGVALLALTACTTYNNPPSASSNSSSPSNSAPRDSAPQSAAPQNPPPPNPAPPGTPDFLVASTLAQSISDEQSAALNAAPASDYDSSDNASIEINCQNTGPDTFTCTGSDTDGDTGSQDNVAVAADGSSWSDSGMTWTGPDVSVPGGYTVAPVTGWTGS